MQQNNPTSPTSRHASRSSSFSSDTQAILKTSIVSSVPAAKVQAAYVAVAAASQMVSDNQRHRIQEDEGDTDPSPSPDDDGALFSDSALALVNAFLDHLLFSLLSAARSTRLSTLKQATEQVLKGNLARLAIASAEEEIEGLMDGSSGPLQENSHSSAQDGLKKSDIEAIWKRTRLRVMVYMRLGEMEDDDEAQCLEEEQLPAHGNDAKLNLAQSEAAIFLTAVLEYIAEQLLSVAGSSAYDRFASKKYSNEESAGSFFDDERVIVENVDVEKLALHGSLGRLWRTWRKQLRSDRPSKSLRSPSSKTVPESTVPPTVETLLGAASSTGGPMTDASILLLATATPLPTFTNSFHDRTPENSRPRSLINVSTEQATSHEEEQSQLNDSSEPWVILERQRSNSLPHRRLPYLDSYLRSVQPTQSVKAASQSDVSGTPRAATDIHDPPTSTMLAYDDVESANTPTDIRDLDNPTIAESRDVPSPDPVPENQVESGVRTKENKTIMETKRQSLLRESSGQSGQSGRDDPFTTPAVKNNIKEERMAGVAPQTSASITDFGSTWAQVDSLVLTARATEDAPSTEADVNPIPVPPKSLERNLTPPKSRFNVPPSTPPAVNSEPHSSSATRSFNAKPLPEPGTATNVSPTQAQVPAEVAKEDPPSRLISGTSAAAGVAPYGQAVSSPHSSQFSLSSGEEVFSSGNRGHVIIEDDEASRPSMGSSNAEREFQEMIRSNRTVKRTLTPQGLRDYQEPLSPISTPTQGPTQSSRNNRAVQTPQSTTQQSVPVANSPGSRSPPFANFGFDPPGKETIQPSGSIVSFTKKGRLLARDARVPSDSTRDFADFIRSTAPDREKATANPMSPAIVPSSPRSRNSNLSTTKTPPRSKARAWEPREPVISRTSNATSDLIAFLRDGPEESNTTGRASQGSSSISNTTRNFSVPERASNSAATTHSMNRSTPATPPSVRASDNSYTGLLANSSNIAAPPVPQKSARGSNAAAPARKQHRSKDPYAIDYSDDEDDVQRPTHDESLIYFLNNVNPPGSRGQPVEGNVQNVSQPSTSNGFYSSGGVESSIGTRPVPPVDEDDLPPAVAAQLYNTSRADPGKPQPRAPAIGTVSTYPRPSGTSDLAEFFKNTEPPINTSEGYGSRYDDYDAAAPPPDVIRGKVANASKGKKGFFGRRS